ncbi:hypothetical protein RND81_08G134300 [Saponaria officinalis]|uniref:YDG domain-containing protein n=1 Tax=Saponaria officinalis TaxID=3572 RepID=A0AAW1J798_SAPOF
MKSPNLDTNLPENYTWWRKVSASKSKHTSNVKIKKNPLPKTTNFVDNNGGKLIEAKTCNVQSKCEELCRISLKERETNRIDFKAMKELRKNGKIPKKSEGVLGSIPGVEIGDTFNYRVELMILGLHGRNQHGINYINKGGQLLETCIVATKGYPNKTGGHDDEGEVLTYIGEGGMYGVSEDQKMEGKSCIEK